MYKHSGAWAFAVDSSSLRNPAIYGHWLRLSGLEEGLQAALCVEVAGIQVAVCRDEANIASEVSTPLKHYLDFLPTLAHAVSPRLLLPAGDGELLYCFWGCPASTLACPASLNHAQQ